MMSEKSEHRVSELSGTELSEGKSAAAPAGTELSEGKSAANDHRISLLPVFRAAESLDHTSRRLLKVMDEQIRAIKSSDAGKVDELTEAYTTILALFRKEEQQLISALERVSGKGRETVTYQPDNPTVRLGDLKVLFPNSAEKIDDWRSVLEKGGRMLVHRHQQLASLLDFAADQNYRLLHSIYRLENQNSNHYGPDGKQSAVNPGSAVNHKA